MAVSDSDVRKIFPTKIEDIAPFIDSANSIINQYDDLKALPEGQQDKIALYLTAHLMSLTQRTALREKIGEADSLYAYEDQLGMLIRSTFYGQMAITFDPTGRLNRLGSHAAELQT